MLPRRLFACKSTSRKARAAAAQRDVARGAITWAQVSHAERVASTEA
jgi:hypothetical protein